MSSWDSDDDDLLNEETGTGAVTAFRDEELDEDALLGGENPVLDGPDGQSGEYTDENTTAGEAELNEEQQHEESHTGGESGDFNEGEEELDYEGDDLIELEITGDDEFGLGIPPEEEDNSGQFADSTLNSSDIEQSEVSSTTQNELSEVAEEHTEAREAQEEQLDETLEEEVESDKEDESKIEDDEEDENEEDDEEEEKRERFKNERKDGEISMISTVSSTSDNRKAIPDKLELSAEQQEEISKFEKEQRENKNKRWQQRGRGGRGMMRGSPQRGGMLGLGPRPQWSGGPFAPQINQPPPQPQKILINPHFQGTIQAQPNILLKEAQVRQQVQTPGFRFGFVDSRPQQVQPQQTSLFTQNLQHQQPHFTQRPTVSWSGPGQAVIQQPLHNQQYYQQQQPPSIFGQARAVHRQGQHLQQQQSPPRLMQLNQPGVVQNRFPGVQHQQGNQMGSQGNRILFGQPAIQPRIHWEGNHNNQNVPPNSRGPPIRFGAPQTALSHTQQRAPFRFGEPVNRPLQIRHQEPAGQPIQTVVGNQRRQLSVPRQQPPVSQQQTVSPQHRPQLSPNKNQPPLSPRRSIKDRLGPRAAVQASDAQPPPQPGGGRIAQKRRSSESVGPVPSKTVKTQSVAVSEDDYQRKLEEQKKIREKIKAMKEKKRQEAAESRRKELLRRLIEEGKTLEDVEDEPVAKKQHMQQPAPAFPTHQGIYINEQGKQVVRMSRAQHDQMVRQGLVNQGQMPLRMLQPPGAQQQRPVLPPPQQLDRFPAQGPPQQLLGPPGQTQRQIHPPQGRGGHAPPGRGRGVLGAAPVGSGRGIQGGPRPDGSVVPGRGRAAHLPQGRGSGGAGVPVSFGRGVQRTLRQVNTSTTVHQMSPATSQRKPVTRQVLIKDVSPKTASNAPAGRGVKISPITVGRGTANAPRGRGLVSRLGTQTGAVRGRGTSTGRGRGLLALTTKEEDVIVIPGAGPDPNTPLPQPGKGRAASLQAPKQTVRTTRNMVALGRGQRLAQLASANSKKKVGGSGDATIAAEEGGPVMVKVTGIPAGGIKEVQKHITRAHGRTTGVDQRSNSADVQFSTMREAKKFELGCDGRIINMGVIHVEIL